MHLGLAEGTLGKKQDELEVGFGNPWASLAILGGVLWLSGVAPGVPGKSSGTARLHGTSTKTYPSRQSLRGSTQTLLFDYRKGNL